MTPFDVLILSLIQGLTEFLPVSSSGHLVLANAVLGLQEPGIAVEMTLHLGTLLAVVLYYRRDLIELGRSVVPGTAAMDAEGRQSSRRMLALLAIGTIPAVVIGVLLRDPLEALYEDPREASYELLATSLLLLATLFVRPRSRPLTAWKALVIGCWQAAALLPGVSRSGATIAGALFLGIAPIDAARFSFLLSIPAIGGAAVLQIPELANGIRSAMAPLLMVGFLVSFVVGYASIAFLLRVVGRGRFGFFGLYCALIGILGLILLQ